MGRETIPASGHNITFYNRTLNKDIS